MLNGCASPYKRNKVFLLLLGLSLGWVGSAYSQGNEQQSWVTLVKAKEGGGASTQVIRLGEDFIARQAQSTWVPAAWYLLGDTYLEGNQPEKAKECFQKLVVQSKQLEFGASVLFRLGECYFNQGDFTHAQTAWEEMLSQYPRSHLVAEVELNQCKRSLHQEKYDEAKTRLQSLVMRYPHYRTHPDVLLGWARIAFSQQLYVGVLEQLAELNTPEATYLKGQCWLNLQKYFEVMSIFNLPSTPENRTQEWLAIKESFVWALLEHEQYTLAMEASDKVAAEAPLNPGLQADMLLVRANSLFSLKQYEQAQADYQEWIRQAAKGQETAYVKFLSGLAYCRQRQFEQAERVWGKLNLDSQPDATAQRLLTLIAQAYFSEQVWDLSEMYFQRLIDRYPNGAEIANAYLRMAQIYYKQGNDRQAMTVYMKYLQHSPRSATGVQPKSGRKDLVISDQDNLETGSDKWVKFYAHDLDEPVADIMLQTSVLSRKQLPIATVEQYKTMTCHAFTPRVAVPWLRLITRSPVLIVNPRKITWALQNWTFTVTNTQGDVLYQQEGGTQVPEAISWDGKKRNGDWLRVGEPFFYTMTIINTAGKTVSTSSELKQLNSIAFIQEGNVHINLLPAMLFTREPNEELTPLGSSVLKEAGSLLIQNMQEQMFIQVVTPTLPQGQRQGELIRKYISGRLQLTEADIEITVEKSQEQTGGFVSLIATKP